MKILVMLYRSKGHIFSLAVFNGETSKVIFLKPILTFNGTGLDKHRFDQKIILDTHRTPLKTFKNNVGNIQRKSLC